MKKTVSGEIEIGNIKRCYVKGVIIKTKCPKCGAAFERDLGDDYLSYPEIGETHHIGFYCEKCEENEADYIEYEIPVKVVSALLTLEYDPEAISEA